VATSLDLGTELLGYRIEAQIGRGGMSVVYRAHHETLDRKVALKVLAPELREDERFRERFLRESKLAASIEHPNIVPIYDAGEVDGRLYIAMRHVEGSDLKTLLRREGALEPRRALVLVAQLADALDAAHARGLVHRDVKPSNVLVDGAGRPYLSDFGLTKSVSDRSALTATGQIVGTVDYVAPELIEGKAVDGRADVYSLGCVLYECLTGEVPFPRDSELAVLFAHVQEPPPRPSDRRPELGRELDGVIAKALAKAPEQRYATDAELVEAARTALPVAAPPARSRRRLLVALAALLAAVGAAAAALALALGGESPSTEPTLAITVPSLQRIDPATNRLAATIGLGSHPTSVSVGEGAVWVVDATARTVTRIDPHTHATKTAPAGSDPWAVQAGAGSVWVANLAAGVLLELDPKTLELHAIKQLGQPGLPSLAVVGNEVWAGTRHGLTVLNPTDIARGEVNDIYNPLTLAAGEGSLWVRHAAAGIWRIDPPTRKVLAKIDLPFRAFGLAAGEGGVWVTHTEGDALVEIDPDTNRIGRRVDVGGSPFGLAVGYGSVWVANFADGTVSRVDPKRGKVVATIEVGTTPEQLAVGEDGVWVIVQPR
jgi:YVTN family beta-propeller protein